MYAPPPCEERMGVDEEGVRGRPRSLRWVGVSGMSVISSGGAQKGRRELEVARMRRMRREFRDSDSRLEGTGLLTGLALVSMWCRIWRSLQ
jgi:hypothetical protein